MKKATVKPLVAAVAVASAAASVQAKQIEVFVSGFAQSQLTNIQNLPAPNPPTVTDSPAQFQIPRIAAQATPPDSGLGWPTVMRLVIEDTTQEVVDFDLMFITKQYFSASNTQHDWRDVGFGNFASTDFRCDNVNDDSSADGLIQCNGQIGLVANQQTSDMAGGEQNGGTVTYPITSEGVVAAGLSVSWAGRRMPGYRCGSTDVTASTSNGCGRNWNTAVFLGPPVAAINPITYIPRDARYAANWGGNQDAILVWEDGDGGETTVCLNVLANPPSVLVAADQASCEAQTTFGVTPPIFAVWNITAPGIPYATDSTNDPVLTTSDTAQRESAIESAEFQGRRAGGFFDIEHTGTVAGGDLEVTGVWYSQDTDIDFPTPAGPGVGKAQSYTLYNFDHVILQRDAASSGGKNVPAMGAFGLAALFGGLVAIAAGLRRRVS